LNAGSSSPDVVEIKHNRSKEKARNVIIIKLVNFSFNIIG
jgi:hypothetical protein